MSREVAMRKYKLAKESGEVDIDIIPLLDKLNALEEYYTTSSCSGRIVIMEIPEVGDKINSKFLGKWHRQVNVSEVKEAIASYSSGNLYFLVQSAILHVVSKDINSAMKLIKIGKETGFKYSSIRVINDAGVLVELLSTEHLQIPLGTAGKLKVCSEDIAFFVTIANKLLARIKNKLSRLEEKISCLLPSSF